MLEPEFRSVLLQHYWGERFLARVSFGAGCWLWNGVRTRGGYGIVGVFKKTVYCHRLIHETTIGPIPEKYQVDHVRSKGCTSTSCIRPDHLEAVTRQENIARSSAINILNARKTHCPLGHEYAGENLHQAPRGRVCRACDKVSYERNREQKLAAKVLYYQKNKERIKTYSREWKRKKAAARRSLQLLERIPVLIPTGESNAEVSHQ